MAGACREKAQGRAASVAYADSFGDVGGTGVYYLARSVPAGPMTVPCLNSVDLVDLLLF